LTQALFWKNIYTEILTMEEAVCDGALNRVAGRATSRPAGRRRAGTRDAGTRTQL